MGITTQDTTPLGAADDTFDAILARRYARRDVLRGAIAGSTLAALPAALLAGCGGDSNSPDVSPTPQTPTPQTPPPGKLAFTSIPVATSDTVTVPPGYTARVLYAWGDPVSNGPQFKQDASNTAEEQALQAGMHHDGIWFFPLPLGNVQESRRGLLAMNHEYTDTTLLHTDGGYAANAAGYTRAKANKEIASHGVSIVEVEIGSNGQWSVVRPSQFGRRITGDSPIAISGPAAGHALLRTSTDASGREARGTVNNCGMGVTPWGTYLTCEENFAGYFDYAAASTPANKPRLDRYGFTPVGAQGYRWATQVDRFDINKEPNEPNRFGWVVEIDPYDPASKPVKRTAIGRFAHEGAWVVTGADNKVVVYSGDDSRFEYLYKFVATNKFVPGNREANRNLLDDGILYVAKFNADGSGSWLPLVYGQGPLTAANGFNDQGEVLIFARAAADAVGATKMDRPEWITHDPLDRTMYLTLTNNTARTAAQVDASNPRAANLFGHIMRWRETGNDPSAPTFRWDIFALAGNPDNTDPNKRGNINGAMYGSPDGLWMDSRRQLWIQTDVSDSDQRAGDYAPFGNNMMVAADPDTGATKRFLTGPVGCEVTGITSTPDLRTFFVNIQHPGDVPRDLRNAGVTLTPANPKAASSWPDGPNGGRPRSATVVITKDDGGVIGS